MKIALLATDLGGKHGWSQVALQVARGLIKQGVPVTLVTTTQSPVPDDLTAIRILPDVLPLAGGMTARLAAAYPALRHALRDCTHIHCTCELYAPLAWALAGRRKLFITGHGTYVQLPIMRGFPLNRLYTRAFRASTLVCVSHYTERIARALLPDLRTRVILNGVDAARFVDLPHPQLSGERWILTSGGIKTRKGTRELVQAMAHVIRQNSSARLVIVGNSPDNSYVQSVREVIVRERLQDHVQIAGFVSDDELRDWYGRASIFALPSINRDLHFEGFGLVHLEASAAGLPVVGTRGCGIEDAIDDGVTGLLVSQQYIATELPDALLRLLGDDALATRLGNAGILKAQTLTWERTVSALIELYNA